MSEFERLRNSDTGIPLQTKEEVEDYACVVMLENQALRPWKRLVLDFLPEIPGLEENPAKARLFIMGIRLALHERLQRVERDREALYELLAHVPPERMPEDWQKRDRAFRGGYKRPPEETCPGCGSPSRAHFGMVPPERGAEQVMRLCAHAWHGDPGSA